MTVKCEPCDGALWVCEAHSDLPSDIGASPRARQCEHRACRALTGNASAGPHEPPRLPTGFMVTLDDNGQGTKQTAGVPRGVSQSHALQPTGPSRITTNAPFFSRSHSVSSSGPTPASPVGAW